MVIFSEITETDCITDRYSHPTAKICLVQDFAAMSAIANFLLLTYNQH